MSRAEKDLDNKGRKTYCNSVSLLPHVHRAILIQKIDETRKMKRVNDVASMHSVDDCFL